MGTVTVFPIIKRLAVVPDDAIAHADRAELADAYPVIDMPEVFGDDEFDDLRARLHVEGLGLELLKEKRS